jgi:carboxypeptidase C (cathepsin A)
VTCSRILFGWLFLAIAPMAWCQTPTPPAAPAKPADAKEVSIELTPSVTKHTATLNGTSLAYTATAAQIPIRNETGEVECRMFYVAYTKDGTTPDQRPVTFAFNGGPGSATLWLHMGALGPKRAPMNDDGSLPRPPYTAVDNAETWLDFTDVVCVDAPATGYSRVAKKELNSKFFGVREDISAFTQFVRGWLKEHKRWRSPVFIAGESYGGIRGSGLCTSLFDEGVAVSGFVSISGTSNFLTLDSMRGNDATYIGFLPSMAACAWYHNKVSHTKYKDVADLVAEAKQWTDTVYGPALQLGDSLTDAQKDKIAEKLSFYLGLRKKYCLGSNLKISEFAFFRELLRDDGMTIGRYDGRLVGKEETREGFWGLGDPSDEAVNAPFTSSINDYLDRDLAVKTDMTYMPSGGGGFWKQQEGAYSETASDLSRLLLRNPNFRVLYCCGYYDLACPFNATHFTVNHMGLDTATRSHVSFAYYPAGHMMYIEKSSRKKLHNDVATFVASTLGQSTR